MLGVKSLLQVRHLFLCILILGIVAMAARNVADPDLWWHLKTGQWIMQHHAVPHSDVFSYTRAGQPWVAHEWLSEVFLYGLFRAAGWGGLIAVFSGVIAAAFFLLYLRCAATPYAAGAILLLGALAARPTWGVRPQMLSFLLASIWLLMLDRSEQNSNVLWWTLPLTLLWVNLHAGFALGLALLALYAAGESLEIACRANPNEALRRHRNALARMFCLNLLVVPLNPNGLRMFVYPIETLRSQAMQNYIAEWFSPNFHKAEYWPFLFLLLASIAAFAGSPGKVRPRNILLLLASCYAGLVSVRMIPVFVLVAAPIFSRQLEEWAAASRWSFGKLLTPAARADFKAGPSKGLLPHAGLRTLLHVAIVAAMGVFVCLRLVTVIRQQAQVEASQFPVGAVAFLQEHPPNGNIFNHYDWGGYLIWTLYPGRPVFIDGRADVYGEELLRQFADTYQLKGDWMGVLNQWRVATVVVPHDSPLATALPLVNGWSVMYEDPQATILARVANSEAEVQGSGQKNHADAGMR